jgi:hypothetical protein
MNSARPAARRLDLLEWHGLLKEVGRPVDDRRPGPLGPHLMTDPLYRAEATILIEEPGSGS